MEQEIAEVHGIVEWVGKRFRENSTWGSREFKVRTPKKGSIFYVRSNSLCSVEVEDSIYMFGPFVEDKEDGKTIYRMHITDIPIIEPRVSESAIIKVIVNSMYRMKESTFALKCEQARKIYEHLILKTEEIKEYDGMEEPDRVNQHLTKLSNLLMQAGNAGRETAINDLIDPFGGMANPLAEQKAASLLIYWYKEREMRKLLMLGLSEKEIQQSPYPTDILYLKARSNPYTLPFIDKEHAYELMLRIGKTPTDMQVTCGDIVRMMYDYVTNKGCSCTPVVKINKKFSNMYLEELTALTDEDGNTPYGYDCILVPHEGVDYLYFIRDYKVEKHVYVELARMIQQPPNIEVQPIRFRESLSEDQETAVQGILMWPVSVLTGSGGTGKTATITEVVKNLIARNRMFVVTSFTGRAVSRVKQEMRKAGVRDFYRLRRTMTMHRAIYKGLACANEELTHLIIDEASMVTTKLFSMFLERFRNVQWILFVGDCNQLLPIEWGCLFKNLIQSGTIPVYRLTKVHRVIAMQGVKDGITKACQTIADAPEGVDIPFEETDNFQIISGDEMVLFNLMNDMHTAGVTDNEITVVTPFNKTVDIVNTYIQKLYRNGCNSIMDSNKRKWCVGDRVVMTENNYDINVMNGDEGRILGIQDGQKSYLLVSFDDGEEELNPLNLNTTELQEAYVQRFKGTSRIHLFSLKYTPKSEKYCSREPNVGMLQHGYAITVHKGQGSEWPFTVFYIPPEAKASRSFLCRNLIYTASSRGKKCLRIVGNIESFQKGCTLRPSFRHELLCSMLSINLPKAKAGLDGRDIVIGVFSPEEEKAMKYMDDDFDFDDDF